MAKPSVTVLVDTYNHEKFIVQALTSVLEQDFPAAEMEILVVDDGSTDRTPEIVRQLEPRVRLIRKQNGGQASAFNVGIPQARGEIVAFLDGDDWWAPNKLSRVTETMANDRAIGIVGHGIVTVHTDGQQEKEILLDGFRFSAKDIGGVRLLRRRGSFLGTSRMTIRKNLLREIGHIPEAIAIQADEYLFTMAAVLAVAQIIPEPLTYYRMHDANAFQLSSFDRERIGRKQAALAALADGLSERLERLGLTPNVRKEIVEIIRANADQFRLMNGSGWPWETLKTEWKIYGVLHPDAAIFHRIFKAITLLGALAVTPRTYYAAQRMLSRNQFYLRARRRYLPVPKMQHIRRESQIHS
jgi:glycosyltransferase involved in cell wall biosynthesis